MGQAALRARSAIRTDVTAAVERLQRDLRPVMDSMEDAMQAQSEDENGAAVKGVPAPSRDAEMSCALAVANVHGTIAAAASRHAEAFPWKEAASSIGGMSVVCLVLSVTSTFLMCCGRPGAGFEADKGLQMGLSGFDGLGAHAEAEREEAAKPGPPPSGRGTGSRDRSSSGSRRSLGRLPGALPSAPAGSTRARAGGHLGLVYILTLGAALIQAFVAGYFAVRVAFGAGSAGSAVADLVLPLRPKWVMPHSAASEEAGGEADEEESRARVLGERGVSALAATVFGSDIPPRCASVLEESQAAWRGAVVDVARVPLSQLAWRAPWALVSWIPGTDGLAPSPSAPSAQTEGASCWWAVWPVSALVDSAWSHPAAVAQARFLRSLDLLAAQMREEGAGDAVGALVKRSGAEAALARYSCSDWVLQSQGTVPQSTVVVMAAAIFVFLAIQAVRGSAIDAAGLGLRYRISDLGLGMGVNAAAGQDLTIDMDEDATLAKKRT